MRAGVIRINQRVLWYRLWQDVRGVLRCARLHGAEVTEAPHAGRDASGRPVVHYAVRLPKAVDFVVLEGVVK